MLQGTSRMSRLENYVHKNKESTWLSTQMSRSPTCYTSVLVRPSANLLKKGEVMKIGISLLSCNDLPYLKPCLESLLESDINNHDFKLCAWDNNSTDETKDFIKSLDVNKTLIESKPEEMPDYNIVLPRIKLYEMIKKENYDFLLEVHADMLFPKVWIDYLFDIDDEDTIVLEPHIVVPSSTWDNKKLEEYIANHSKDRIYTKCRQVHPWLVKLDMLDLVGGYYDPIFAPQRCEDEDLVWRILQSEYNIKSTAKSWVLHYGGKTRNNRHCGDGAGHDHIEKLCKKHGIKVDQISQHVAKLTEFFPAIRV